MIAEYLFNKEEDKQMTEVIVNIQKYELDAGRVENMRNRAEVDAMANITNQMLDPSNGTDSQMKSLNYIDVALKKEALQRASSDDNKSETS